MRLSVGLVLVAALAIDPSRAAACSFPGPIEHEIVADPSDTTAPEAPAVAVTHINRGESGCGADSDSCADIGSITLMVGATDDVSPEEEIGFTVTVVEGRLPSSAGPLGRPLRPHTPGELMIVWSEPDDPPFTAVLAVTAVDRAGNVSPPTMIEVSDGTGGCHVARPVRHALGFAPLALALIALALRARR